MYETILYEISGSVAQLTMNRPDKYNAFTGQMLEEMSSALKKAARDEEVRCILLTGAGKAFNAGQDLGDVLGADTQETASSHGEVLRKRYNPLIMQICKMEKPVIAVINGAAAGAGMSIALACDLRIMSEKAYFVNAFVRSVLFPTRGLLLLATPCRLGQGDGTVHNRGTHLGGRGLSYWSGQSCMLCGAVLC